MMPSLMGLPVGVPPPQLSPPGRRNSRDKKKAPWTAEEDGELRRWVRTTYGDNVEPSVVEWSAASSVFPNRSTKQIRERWCNVLDPSIKRDEWAEHELRILFEAQQELGNKWSEIAKRLPGRPEAAVKNTFYSSQRRARRRLQRFGENRTPNLSEIAVEAIEACKTAQALKVRREQARMRAGSTDEGEDDQSGSLSSTPGRKGGKKSGMKGGKRKATGGRKRGRDLVPTTLPTDAMLGGPLLGDLGAGGLDFPLDAMGVSAGMRMGLPGMGLFGGATLPAASMVSALPGMSMMLPGLGGGFGALPGATGGLNLGGGVSLPLPSSEPLGANLAANLALGSAMPPGLTVPVPPPATNGDASTSKAAAVDLPANALALLNPLSDAAALFASTPAMLKPEETVVVLARYHPTSNTTIPLQWTTGADAAIKAAAASAALSSAAPMSVTSGATSGALATTLVPATGAMPAGANAANSALASMGVPTLPNMDLTGLAAPVTMPGLSAVEAPAAGTTTTTSSTTSEGAASEAGAATTAQDTAASQAQAPPTATAVDEANAAPGEAANPSGAAAAGSTASRKGGEDDKTHVATLLASLGNGWIAENGTPNAAKEANGAAEAEAEVAGESAAKKARTEESAPGAGSLDADATAAV